MVHTNNVFGVKEKPYTIHNNTPEMIIKLKLFTVQMSIVHTLMLTMLYTHGMQLIQFSFYCLMAIKTFKVSNFLIVHKIKL